MAQTSICSLNVKHSIYLECNIKLIMANDMITFKTAMKKFQDELNQIGVQYPESHITGCLAFSVDGWKKVTTNPLPEELKSGNSFTYIPNMSQRDLFIHISSITFDTAFKLSQSTLNNFANTIRIEQEVHGFRRCESRDLSGFIDGTNNPNTEVDREKYALVPVGQPHEKGSYVFTQRWVHHLESWNQQSVQYQQETIGRIKKDSAAIPPTQRPVNSHVSRTQLKDNNEFVKIVRQSLPYGLASGEKGLFFVGFSSRTHFLELLLQNMFGKTDGKMDLILKFTNPVTGGLYFAPSIQELLNM